MGSMSRRWQIARVVVNNHSQAVLRAGVAGRFRRAGRAFLGFPRSFEHQLKGQGISLARNYQELEGTDW
jgi:hypothetical protein